MFNASLQTDIFPCKGLSGISNKKAAWPERRLTMEGWSHANLRQYTFFAGLSDESLLRLSKKVRLAQLTAGTPIITEGVPAKAFYFLAKGEIEIIQKGPSGTKTTMSVASSGEGVGEVVLLTCSHRTNTVTAKSNVTIYELSKQDFSDMILTESACIDMPEEKAQGCSLFNQMKMLTPFARLESDKIYALTEALTEKEYAPGETIIRQGDRGDAYFIIKSGRVAVLKKQKDDQEKLLAELGPGDAFGEEALIRDLPRNATIRTKEKTTVFALNKKAFERIMEATFVKNIFPEDFVNVYEKSDNIVILDARIPPEFEEEHIKGAINIPIEWLRDQYAELDKNKEYYTYCTNDSRGMVAAFLLNINGFKAKIIRGGLSAWPGSVSFGSNGIHWPKQLGETATS
jgi:CRP-like cAMP-binding protein/rhodanese-related sulfurtransferase